MPTRLTRIELKGYRNYLDAVVHLNAPSLVIGANDIGKSNLVHALRLLLDKSLSETELEPKDSDFHAHGEVNDLSITLVFEDVTEDCLLSRMKEHVSDDGQLILRYSAVRDPKSRRKTHSLSAGRRTESLAVIESRYYLKVLNLRHVASRRDLTRFIGYERQHLLEEARAARTDAEVLSDDAVLANVENHLSAATSGVANLAFVRQATQNLNTELSKLSHRHTTQQVVFDVGASRAEEFVSGLRLASFVSGRTVALGGDGRSNQVHLALWAARHQLLQGASPDHLEVSLYCIEEPEAHLHPHQQRRLAAYLSEASQSQVIITTHSPQIASEFPPESVIRLHAHGLSTIASGCGATALIEEELVSFGYRMNVIPAEAYFASAVLLVEGRSELFLYCSAARRLGIDLDRLNVSVISVEGVGFDPYASLLHTLGIPFVVRTDNDVSKVPKRDVFRFAGVQRALALCESYATPRDLTAITDDMRAALTGFPDKIPPNPNRAAANVCRSILADHNYFVASTDLENDLYDLMAESLERHAGTTGREKTVAAFAKAKASMMYEFLRADPAALEALRGSELVRPLEAVAVLAERP